MHRGLKTLIVAGAAALVMAPMQARADGFVSPWIGSAFGSGDGVSNGVSTSELENGQTTFGITAGGMGAGIIGGEVDFGYSPSFFGDKTLFGNNTVMNLMGNVIIGIPIGGQKGAGIRPYVTGGLGLLRTQIDGGTLGNVSSSDNGLGWNAGRRRDGLLRGSRWRPRRPALHARLQRAGSRLRHRRQPPRPAFLARVGRRRVPVRSPGGVGSWKRMSSNF